MCVCIFIYIKYVKGELDIPVMNRYYSFVKGTRVM